MLKSQRQNEILEILKKDGFATVKALSERLFASLPTVRRDLSLLEDEGYINRCHGGAMLISADENTPIYFRQETNTREKAAMCRLAASLVKDRDVIFIDSSSTALRIADNLGDRRGITAVTNSHIAALRCLERNILTYSTGGRLLKESLVYAGYAAESAVESYNADLVFFSAASLSLDGIISDWSDEERSMRSAMCKHAAVKVFMCDRSKIGKNSAFTLARLSDMDYLVTDKPLPESLSEGFSLVSSAPSAYMYGKVKGEE